MKVSIIVAIGTNREIGIGGKLPWHLPADLKFFKKTTLGKPIVMGRKTYESIGKPLPGRLNVVISRTLTATEGIEVFRSIKSALQYLGEQNFPEIFVIGGSEVFNATLPLADTLYITQVAYENTECDAYFPVISAEPFQLVWEEAHEPDPQNTLAYTFTRYERI